MTENSLREVWKLCSECRETTAVTHWVRVDGHLIHDPKLAYALAAGLIAKGDDE